MALYQYSGLILLAPLLAFAVIILGTRPWDLLSRPRVQGGSANGHDLHRTIHGHDEQHVHGSEDEEHNHHAHDSHGHGLDDDEDPKVPQLTAGAKASAYVALAIMAFACLYSWVLLFSSIFGTQLGDAGITVFQYDWVNFSVAGLPSVDYTLAFHLDQLAISMLVVVTTITLLVQFYSQGYMENSAGYARFYAYLSLFAFSMLVIVFAQNFLVIFVGWELVGLEFLFADWFLD